MDSLIASAARALAAGDPLGALSASRCATIRGARAPRQRHGPARRLRAGAEAPAARRARLRRPRATRPRPLPGRRGRGRARRARPRRPPRALDAATRALDALGDRANALHARLVGARRQLLVGDLEAAERTLDAVDGAAAPPPLVARLELTRGELRAPPRPGGGGHGRARSRPRCSRPSRHPGAGRRGRPGPARAVGAVGSTGERRRGASGSPRGGRGRVRVRRSRRRCLPRAVRGRAGSVSLAGRPVLLTLAGALAEAWPADVARDLLIERVFGRATSTVAPGAAPRRSEPAAHRSAAARAQSRLRSAASCSPVDAAAVVVLAPPIDGPAGAILALARGWRVVVDVGARARTRLEPANRAARAPRARKRTAAVRAAGRGRSRRWLAPTLSGFATTMLLPEYFRARHPSTSLASWR